MVEVIWSASELTCGEDPDACATPYLLIAFPPTSQDVGTWAFGPAVKGSYHYCEDDVEMQFDFNAGSLEVTTYDDTSIVGVVSGTETDVVDANGSIDAMYCE
jgi:hypothetical protein